MFVAGKSHKKLNFCLLTFDVALAFGFAIGIPYTTIMLINISQQWCQYQISSIQHPCLDGDVTRHLNLDAQWLSMTITFKFAVMSSHYWLLYSLLPWVSYFAARSLKYWKHSFACLHILVLLQMIHTYNIFSLSRSMHLFLFENQLPVLSLQKRVDQSPKKWVGIHYSEIVMFISEDTKIVSKVC